ncbi:MAG: hypothetical protein JNM76_14830 [Betaproteobacteria bacterium]|nr:hypothetical protein [Betaproteobacteria bacterium]
MNRIELGQALAEMLGGALDDRIGGHITEVIYRVNRARDVVWLKIDADDYQDLRIGEDHAPILEHLRALKFAETAAAGGYFVLTGARLIRRMGDDEQADAEQYWK